MRNSGGSSSRSNMVIRNNLGLLFNKMFNNPKHANLKFLVNNDVYYAEKCILAASSVYWDTFIFPPAEDREPILRSTEMKEIRLSGIEHSESFLVILKHVYGQDIIFSSLSDGLLMESIKLARNYVLDYLHKDFLFYVARQRPHLKNDLDDYDESFFSDLVAEKLAELSMDDGEETR